jgi:hypothetical protein
MQFGSCLFFYTRCSVEPPWLGLLEIEGTELPSATYIFYRVCACISRTFSTNLPSKIGVRLKHGIKKNLDTPRKSRYYRRLSPWRRYCMLWNPQWRPSIPRSRKTVTSLTNYRKCCKRQPKCRECSHKYFTFTQGKSSAAYTRANTVCRGKYCTVMNDGIMNHVKTGAFTPGVK